jgi:nucleoside-diphosphate-sugar epimerase
MTDFVSILQSPFTGDNPQIGRVVVIGKNGFVGSSVIEELQKNRVSVIGLGRSDIELTSSVSQAQLAKVIKPGDVVIFAAGDVPVKSVEQFSSNLLALENCIKGLNGIQLTQFVYISSDAVYEDSLNPLSESSTRAPESLHGLMHLTREIMLESSHLNNILCLVRPTLIYGIRDPHNGYGPCLFIRSAKRFGQISLFGGGEERRDFVHISDISQIICEVVRTKYIGSLNIATGKLNSFNEIAILVSRLAVSKIEIKSVPRNGPMPHNGYRAFSTDLLSLRFPNVQMMPMEIGLQTMMEGDQ